MADANEVMALFNEIYTNIDPSNVQAANKVGTGRFVLESAVGSLGGVPIGTIIPFYDFNGTVTFNTSFRYCNGAVISATGSPINGQTLPDLSGRYMVGFGTDGGGDIGVAAWATAAVGNVNHQINIQHSHTVNAHTHDLSNHTHSVPAHYHGKGTLAIGASGSHHHLFYWRDASSGSGTASAAGNNDPGNTVSQNTSDDTHTHSNADFTGSVGNTGGSNGDSAFTSGTPSTNTSGSASPGTDNQLSTAQSIQPHSIRVRYIMRVI